MRKQRSVETIEYMINQNLRVFDTKVNPATISQNIFSVLLPHTADTFVYFLGIRSKSRCLVSCLLLTV